jgi:hypothetical protein
MAKSDYQEANVLTGTLRTAAFTKPPGIFVALFTSATSDDGSGTEVAGNGYARAQHGPADASWSAPGAGGSSANIGDVQFADPSGGNWGTITHFALYDSVSGGNMLYHGALTASKVVNDGDGGPKFSDGALVVTEA